MTPRPAYTSDRLRTLARDIRSHPRENAAQVVAIGRLLIEAKRLLRHGRFRAWLASSITGYPQREANRAIAAAKRLDGWPGLGRFSASAVRVLARKDVARRADLKRAVLAAQSRGPLVGYYDALSALSGEDLRLVHGPNGSEANEANVESPGEALARRLVDITTAPDVSSVYLSVDADDEDDDPTKKSSQRRMPIARMTVLGERTRTFTGEHLAGVIAEAAGETVKRSCTGCDDPTPSFSKGCTKCKKCERARQKAIAVKRRAKKLMGAA